jgi:phospholipid/cholesterol/gamma-HCH transport system permease protein
MFWKQYVKEMAQLGVNSIGIVLLISFFIGAVICIQMKLNIQSPWMPRWVSGYTTREIMLLEFSSSIMCLILAGKVGSNIASEIGTMRITEQIDALEIMGVNSASYLILPKVIATVFFFPFLAIFSMLVGIAGGYVIAVATGIMNVSEYIDGLMYCFYTDEITYALTKMAFFAFFITTISAYCGYYAKGNSLEVGKASTKAVVVSSIVIMICNLVLTQLIRT